jgi:hypothetical protein
MLPIVFLFALLSAPVAAVAAFEVTTASLPWEQTAPTRSFTVFMEREELSARDRVSRMIFAVQVGKDGPKLESLSVAWQVKQGETLIGQNAAAISNGLLDVSFNLAGLTPGRYDVTAELRQGDEALEKGQTFFRVVEAVAPAPKGRIAVQLPRGIPLKTGTYPVNFGVPFPKGTLWSENNVRLVKADGTPVPAQTTVRSRWGHTAESSIRWLGLDFQAENAAAWWPERKDTRYFLEYGPTVKPAEARANVTVKETEQGLEVDTGAIRFLVRKDGFNLLDDVVLNGKPVLKSSAKDGLYLVDHEGATYRAANDRAVKLTVEEQGALRTTIRAEGWYVKDGSDGAILNYTLPTDKLCKFITRIEAYAGKPYVRILSTWVLTFDSFTVRLKDVGLSLPLVNATQAEFGVEDGAAIRQDVPKEGVYLVQHLPDAFAVENGLGKAVASGERSAGWVVASSGNGLLGIGHRDTWQRFPKELEVLPDALKLHIWPAHGRTHPEIKEYAHEQINRLWFAHQGRELNLSMPWQTYFSVAQIAGNPASGIYSTAGFPMAGIHSSAMGTAITSDLLISFAEPKQAEETRAVAACFQAAPHAVADPAWVCDSLAAGYMHPYDPEKFAAAEDTISNTMRAYWDIQNTCGEYGMWLYRAWHHSALREEGKLALYRLYNATHHYDAYMPWMLYARSGDPFYLKQGSANMRLLTDVQVVHYNDTNYPHVEFHFAQKRLVGSTKHTNGFNTWGGDHAILAHLTCYNAMILAYYMTGDLRLREVVVDEWQRTLIEERKNPEYAKADRTASVAGGTLALDRNSSRDVNNSLGELMDLYQLTYEPRVLAVMAPMMDFFLNKFMRPWGLPLHNVILFNGSEQAKRQLLEGVDEYRKTNGKVVDPKALWYTHAPFDNFALAALVDPKRGAQVDAWLAASVPRVAARAARMQAQSSNCVTFCEVPDWIVYMPRVMLAVARAGGDVSIEGIASAQAMPASDMTCGGWLRCIVRKDKSEPFTVSVRGQIGPDGVPVKVFGPDNKPVIETTVQADGSAPQALTVNDPRTGQFTIFVKARDGTDHLFVPLTALPEVYRVGYWGQHQSARFFTRSAGEQPESVEITPHRSAGSVLTDDQQMLGSSTAGEPIHAEIGPQGAWIVMEARYVHLKNPVTLSVSRDRWFAPDADKLNLKP